MNTQTLARLAQIETNKRWAYEPTYGTVETSQIIQSVQEQHGLMLSNLSFRGKSTAHVARLRDTTAINLFDSTVFPEIVVRNSYECETSLTVSVGFYRLVCANGMTVGTDLFSTGRVQHRKGTKLTHVLDNLHEQIADALLEVRNGLPSVQAKVAQALPNDFSITNLCESLGYSQKLIDAIEFEWQYRRIPDQTGTWFDVWNVINETQRKRSRSPYARESFNETLLSNILKESEVA